MSDEVKDEELDDKPEESPEQKASKIDKQYNEQMKFIAKVLGSDSAINPPRQLEGDMVANVVAKVFREREEKLTEEATKGLTDVLDLHLKSEQKLKEEENKLKGLKTQQRKEFIKVVKAWRNKISEQSVSKEGYTEALKKAIEDSKED